MNVCFQNHAVNHKADYTCPREKPRDFNIPFRETVIFSTRGTELRVSLGIWDESSLPSSTKSLTWVTWDFLDWNCLFSMLALSVVFMNN